MMRSTRRNWRPPTLLSMKEFSKVSRLSLGFTSSTFSFFISFSLEMKKEKMEEMLKEMKKEKME